MAVGAQQGKVAELCSGLPADMQGHDVVTLDVAAAPVAVGLLEVEMADFACQRLSGIVHGVEFAPSERLVMFIGHVSADQQSSLRGAVALVGNWRGQSSDLSSRLGGPDGLRNVMHQGRLRRELGDHPLSGRAAVGGPARMTRPVRRQISRLARDAVDATEIWSPFMDGMERQPAQEVRQVDDPRVGRRDLAPAIPGNQVPGQDQLFPLPVQPARHILGHAQDHRPLPGQSDPTRQ